MPTYEYKCTACEHLFEKFQSITADPIRKCPQCGKNKVKRLISTGAGMIFKGSGFYITDYRSESYKNAAKSDSGAPSSDGKASTDGKAAPPSESKADSPAPAKTESKPPAKSESKPAAKKK